MSTSKRRRLDTEEQAQRKSKVCPSKRRLDSRAILIMNIAMSAFALRKKLLAQQSQVASPSVDQAQAQPTARNISIDASAVVATRQKKVTKATKITKTRVTRPASVEPEESSPRLSHVSPSQPSVELPRPSVDQADRVSESLSPSSLDEEEGNDYIHGPAQPVDFSSFRPSKTNFRKRGNGVCQLKLREGDVCPCLRTFRAID